jgi:putative transposase
LDHAVGFHGRFGATFFVTICCKSRRTNQLCHQAVANPIFETARRYHWSERWYLELLLLMPDHLHMLIAIPGDTDLSNLIRDFKRIASRKTKVAWQRNFFDHRLRNDESESEKAQYIYQNPVRAGLIGENARWPYVIDESDLDPKTKTDD